MCVCSHGGGGEVTVGLFTSFRNRSSACENELQINLAHVRPDLMSNAQQWRPVVVIPLLGRLVAKVEEGQGEVKEDHHSLGSLPLAFCFSFFSSAICMTTTEMPSGIL